ncbi:MAG: phosphotransferase, partial [Flavobacteriaceae bacterium]
MPKNVLKKHFDIEADHISTLEGYDSINYKIETTSGTYVLKQYDNTASNKEMLLAENATLKVLSGLKAFDFPVALPNKKMEHLPEEDDALFRLLSFVEGEFLGDVEHTPTLLRSFGTFLGKIDNALLNFERSAISAKVTPWDLKHFHLSYNYLKYIPDAKQRSLV